ncbi:MAG: hypothetical protein ACPGU7_01455 [Gammaproteobacteria bacterium]
MNDSIPDPYLTRFRGYFRGVMRWHELDALWDAIRAADDDDWFIYAVGETPPDSTASNGQLAAFITHIDALLRKEHEEDYCGIVYVDDPDNPAFVKIFDPNNLGVSCGFSDNPPLPGWVLSKLRPSDLPSAFPPPANRRRWWQRLFPS